MCVTCCVAYRGCLAAPSACPHPHPRKAYLCAASSLLPPFCHISEASPSTCTLDRTFLPLKVYSSGVSLPSSLPFSFHLFSFSPNSSPSAFCIKFPFYTPSNSLEQETALAATHPPLHSVLSSVLTHALKLCLPKPPTASLFPILQTFCILTWLSPWQPPSTWILFSPG